MFGNRIKFLRARMLDYYALGQVHGIPVWEGSILSPMRGAGFSKSLTHAASRFRK